MPPASRITDMHVCPMVTPGVPPVPHVGGPILPPGVPQVLIGFLPAATVTNMCVCVGPPDTIVKGSSGVFINYLPAARMGDTTAHGGTIVMGEPTVMIGETGSGGGGGGGGGAAGAAGVAGGSSVAGADDTPIDENSSEYNTNGDGSSSSDPSTAGPAAGAAGGAAADPNNPITPSLQADIDKSPTLKAQVQDLKDKGWTFKYGDPGKGTFADRSNKTIVMDPNMATDNASSLTYLSHEVGHAERDAPVEVPMDGLTKDQYVDQNTHGNLQDEADATINNIKVQEELQQNGGPNIGIAGAQADQYKQMYDSDPSTARENIANAFGDGEHPSTDTSKTYSDYYGQYWKDKYDAANSGGH